ncbi:MAG: GGDEF domain-containing protein, partial [Deltaproteobacteria bacterium]|nr:GGDEF domain-containing protein [Deltaproteobacteria bacterium]
AAGKVFFDDIRSAQTELDTQLMARAERERAESRAELRNVQVATFVTAALLFLFGAVFVRAILQQTVRPLATLSRLAQSGEPFARPSQDIHIREIGLLTDALVTLDREARLRARLVETAHADAVDLSAFGELVQQLADEQELYGVLGRRLSEVAHPVRHNILVRNASKNRLRIASSSDPVLDEPERFPILSKPLACRAVRSLRPIVSSPGAISCCDCPLGVPDQGAYVCFPMLAAGEVVGVVNLQLETPLETSVQQRCGGYVNLAASALSSISHLASAKERTLRDAMTGAYNRGFLQEYLPKLVAQSTRRGSPFALLMFDLDRFKRLNDTYGHQVGDQALVSFSSCLHQQVRSGDAVVRYGGEEFLVLLADTDTPGAMIVAERIRAAVERIVVTTAKETLGPILRCSIGVASCPTHARDDRSLIAAADRALYQAKNTGRNKVVLAELSTSANETPAQGHKVSSTTADSDDATAALPAVA